MVLTQLVLKAHPQPHSVSFHTTMVLTQPKETETETEVVPLFPYHYGSHATGRGRERKWQKKSSFHTTMVLTQLSDLV